MRLILLLLPLVLIACGRPLTPHEAAFATQLHGASIDPDAIRLIKDIPMRSFTSQRQKRPRLACRERLYPEPKAERVTVSPAAVVWRNHVMFSRGWHRDNFLRDYPKRLDLADAMLLAHEITHAWQWQNRASTGYSPLRAAREHKVSEDPYLFDIETRAQFLDYGYEQQASIVEEYVCCAALDPNAPRTQRIAKMLRASFPMQALYVPDEIVLPWDGVQIDGICR